MNKLRDPTIAASIAALLAALGVEVQEALWTHIVEIAAMVIAIIGIVLGIYKKELK